MTDASNDASLSRNPFTVGRPVAPLHFIGRTNEIETAFDQILSHSNLALWGGPGIGKSSFLELLASPQAWQVRGYDPVDAVIVLVNCLSLVPFTGTAFWEDVFQGLKAQLEDDPDLQTQVSDLIEQGKASKDCLRIVLRELGRKGKYLVLLVDDYDVALRTNDQYDDRDIAVFLSDCRNIASHSRERQFLSMVVASARRLNDLGPKLKPDGSPWYNHYLFQPLRPFNGTEIAALLGGLPMTPALREGMLDIAGGTPALLQNAGYLLYRELRAGHVPDASAFARDFQSATEHYFEDVWNLSNEVEQTLMMLLALLGLKGRILDKRYELGDIDIIFSQKERELTDLEERGVVTYHLRESQRVYHFASSIMEWWVVKEIENSDEEALQQRQTVFLNLMSRRQSETVTKAIRWLWQHKEEVPSILEWVVKVSAALPKGLIPGI
jgi:hypothetical protein